MKIKPKINLFKNEDILKQHISEVESDVNLVDISSKKIFEDNILKIYSLGSGWGDFYINTISTLDKGDKSTISISYKEFVDILLYKVIEGGEHTNFKEVIEDFEKLYVCCKNEDNPIEKYSELHEKYGLLPIMRGINAFYLTSEDGKTRLEFFSIQNIKDILKKDKSKWDAEIRDIRIYIGGDITKAYNRHILVKRIVDYIEENKGTGSSTSEGNGLTATIITYE